MKWTIPQIRINVVVSLVLAPSSIIMCEKWLGSNSGSWKPLDKQPAVSEVKIIIRNLYMYFKHGIRNWPFMMLELEHFIISLFRFFTLYDFAYIRKIISLSNNFNKRVVISSQWFRKSKMCLYIYTVQLSLLQQFSYIDLLMIYVLLT